MRRLRGQWCFPAAGSALSPNPAIEPLPSRECLRPHLGAGRGERADRLALLRRPLPERLVGQVLPGPWALVGDQASHRRLGRRRQCVARAHGLLGGDRLVLLAQRRLEHLGVEVLLAPARTLKRTAGRGDTAIGAGKRRRRVRARVSRPSQPPDPSRLMLRRPGGRADRSAGSAARCGPCRRAARGRPRRPRRRPPRPCSRPGRSRRAAGRRAASRSPFRAVPRRCRARPPSPADADVRCHASATRRRS